MMTPAAPAVLSAVRHRGNDPWAGPAETADDRRLREQIERALLATGHRILPAVMVSVRDRRVTIRGQVPRYYLRQLALAAVQTTPGVRGLRDEVSVAPPD